MKLLGEEEQRWYCFKDDEVWLGKKHRWLEETAPSLPETGNVYDAFYVDGYQDLPSSRATISLSEERIEITFAFRRRNSSQAFKLKFPFASIEVLNITQEREITALRTFLFTATDKLIGTKSGLMGPVYAAWLKKKTLSLTIGVRENGLLELPSFKMETGIINSCYAKLYERIQKAKASSSKPQLTD